MRYNNETLNTFCEENNVILLYDYSKVDIKRENYLEGKCSKNDCTNHFRKDFRQLVKTGPYCLACLQIENSHIMKTNTHAKYNKILSDFCEENKAELLEDYSTLFLNRDTIIQGKCKTENCNDTFEKPLRQLLIHKNYCAECCKELGKEKGKKTFIEKYGYDHPTKNKEQQEKTKNTIMEKYGVECILQEECIKNMIKKGNLEKYGVECTLQCPEIRKEIIKTNLQKYGCNYPLQNKDIRKKGQKTVQQKYGVDCVFQNQTIKDKIVDTNIKIYGVPHHLQNAESAEKHLQCSYKVKQYVLPSGKIITYQGYENFAFDELLQIEKIKENDLVTSRKCVPEIWYLDTDGKEHRHYVDIFIPSQNRCVEVKSTWTLQQKTTSLRKRNTLKNWVTNMKFGSMIAKETKPFIRNNIFISVIYYYAQKIKKEGWSG